MLTRESAKFNITNTAKHWQQNIIKWEMIRAVRTNEYRVVAMMFAEEVDCVGVLHITLDHTESKTKREPTI